MLSLFSKRYREDGNTRDRLVTIIIFSLFIFIFLFIFKPFGISQFKSLQQLFLTFGFGVVTAFMLIVFMFLIVPRIKKDNWTIGKEILWSLLIASSIGVANYFYIYLIFHQVFYLKYLLLSVWTAILVGILPVTLSIVINLNRSYRSALQSAEIVPEEILWTNETIIRAGNPKNEVRVNPKNIVYICSNDNYVTVVTNKEGVHSKTTIRGTLKEAESDLKNNSRFLRCHKCYIVNLDFAERLTGHSQNMRIRLVNSETEIPVSRSKVQEVSKKMRIS